jgi:hypothetical protein
MDDTWIREHEDPAPAGPMGDPGEHVPHASDPQEGQIVRTTEDIPEAAAPTHPGIGDPIGS